jgi:hypothetical protein
MKRGHQLLARVPSLSDPKTLYDVTLYGGETWCECQAFASWKKRGEACWHVRVYKSMATALDRCWTEHDTQDGFVCRACLLALLSAMAGAVKTRYVDKEEAKQKVKQARATKAAVKERRKKRDLDPTASVMARFERRARRDALTMSNVLGLSGDGVARLEQCINLAMVGAWVIARKAR